MNDFPIQVSLIATINNISFQSSIGIDQNNRTFLVNVMTKLNIYDDIDTFKVARTKPNLPEFTH